MDKSQTSNPKSQILGVAVAYALAIGLMALPASLQLSRRLLGHSIDTWIFYWNNWWLERAIVEGHDWLFTPYLFYPQGASLVAHSNSFLNSLAAFALKPLMGPVAAYNLVLLLGLWIGAIGMFLLVHEMTHRSFAALLAGFVFAFAPYHLTQALAHANLGSIHWWPFYVLFLRRALRRHQVTSALCAGLFAALTLWSGLHLALLLAVWTATYAGWRLLPKTDSRTRSKHFCLRFVGIVGIVGVVTLTLSAPVVLPVARDWHKMADLAAVFDEGMSNQTDLLAYLLPPSYHPLVGKYVFPFYHRFKSNETHMPYLGYTVLALALVSLLSPRKEARFWLLSAGFWMLLAAGSAPRLNGTVYSHIPLPYRLIEHLFPISAIRVPDRFNLLVVLSLAVSTGLGAAQLGRRRRWLLAPLMLLVLVEYLCIPIPMLDFPPVSPFFTQMSQEEASYGIVDYPMGYTPSKQWLYYQTLHGKATVEGHVSRYTPENYAFIVSQPLLQAFYQIAERPVRVPADKFTRESITISALGPALRSLETSGVRYILLHEPYLDAARLAHFRRVLPILPIYEDTTLTVYDTSRPWPVHYDGFPIPLTSDVALTWFDVQHDGEGRDEGKAENGEHEEWRLQIMAVLLAQRNSPLECQIQLIGEAEDIMTLPITLFDTRPETETTWEEGDLEILEVETSLPRTEDGLDPGVYHWAIACPGEGTAAYTAPETLEVHTDGHITYLRRRVNVCYNDTIALQGYRWRTIGPELQVALQWEALEAPRADYKVFVHLLDADGEIVRQHDAVPCNWQCPTSQWHAGDVVLDQATIPLGTLPPGEYRLAVGLYLGETLERLPAQGPDGESIPDNYFILPDPFVISR